MVGSVQDITDLAQTRQRLEQANRQNEALLNSAADGIYGLDLDGRITFANPAATALTGYSVEETLGRRHHELVHHRREDGTPYPSEDCPCTGGARARRAAHRLRRGVLAQRRGQLPRRVHDDAAQRGRDA